MYKCFFSFSHFAILILLTFSSSTMCGTSIFMITDHIHAIKCMNRTFHATVFFHFGDIMVQFVFVISHTVQCTFYKLYKRITLTTLLDAYCLTLHQYNWGDWKYLHYKLSWTTICIYVYWNFGWCPMHTFWLWKFSIQWTRVSKFFYPTHIKLLWIMAPT